MGPYSIMRCAATNVEHRMGLMLLPAVLLGWLLLLLVPGHKYPKMKGDHLYGGTDTHGCFAIYFFNPCFRVLMAWDK